MASTSAVGPVCTAALAKLRSNAAVTALVPIERIVDQVLPRTVFPYISVETLGERAFDTMGGTSDLPKFGSITRLFIRMRSQYGGEAEIAGIWSAVKAVLHNADLVVTGYPTVSIELQDMTAFLEFDAVVTREWIADFDVTVHQS